MHLIIGGRQPGVIFTITLQFSLQIFAPFDLYWLAVSMGRAFLENVAVTSSTLDYCLPFGNSYVHDNITFSNKVFTYTLEIMSKKSVFAVAWHKLLVLTFQFITE